MRNQIMNQIVVANLNDNTNSWDLLPTGKYIRREIEKTPFSAHTYFMQNPSLSGRGRSLKVSAPKELAAPKRKPRKSSAKKAANAN